MRPVALLLFAMSMTLTYEALHPRGFLAQEIKPDPVADLIRQLGDDDFDKREVASKTLVGKGEAILAGLRRAAASDPDLEIQRRAKEIIAAITPSRAKSKSLGTSLLLVESGEFEMGSPGNEPGRRPDEILHRVRISQPFYLGEFEVTQAEYLKVLGTNPSWFTSTGREKDKLHGEPTDRFPVDSASWYDALEFCNRLGKNDGYEPYYKLTDVEVQEGSIRKATVTVLAGNGYRLPTEAEWEFACRAGTRTAFSYGPQTNKGDANLKAMIVSIGYGEAPRFPDLGRPTAVGSYPGNALLFRDMHGNVGEWCWDWYGRDYYTNSPKDDPRGPREGTQRVARGGSWLVTDASARAASRIGIVPEGRYNTIGFRIARTP